MNVNSVAPAAPTVPEFKDRRTGLIVFGILEMLLGGLAALMIPLMLIGQTMAAHTTGDPLSLRQIVPGVVFYGMGAAVLLVLGFGSCRSRRWAWALSLVVAWSWLAVGVLSLVAVALFLPGVLNVPQPQGQALPESARLVGLVIAMVFMTIFFVLVPGALILFYRSRHVRATCEARDPSPNWTDACPLPVLGLSLWLGFGAFTMLTLPLSTRGVLPVFGRLISGLGGSICCVMLAALWGYCAWAVYRLRAAGWWTVLVSVIVMTASAWVTFARMDLMEMYRAMGYPERQIEMMKQYSFIQGPGMAWLSMAGALALLGYLLFAKRYFRPAG